MILIGQYDSPFVRRVGIALTLYGLPFEHRPWSTFGDADKIAAYNPLRRVPTLVLDTGEALIEGTASVDYLDETVGPDNAMLPARGEARRRREPGHDWAILELGTLGEIDEILVDTAHFKGNYPDRCSIQAAADARGTPAEIAEQAEDWPVLLPETTLRADHEHRFREEVAKLGPIRFVRLNIYPDGGVSRLRLMGSVARHSPRGV